MNIIDELVIANRILAHEAASARARAWAVWAQRAGCGHLLN